MTKAEGRNQTRENPLKVSAQKVQYGKMQTKKSITNVLDVVIDQYRYTSLPELNAILKLYDVMADWGREDTTMFQKRGLVYTALDDKGNKIGTPINASAFYSKPMLKYLEQKFVQNEALRQVHQQQLNTAIKWVLVKEKQTLTEFIQDLAKKGITVVLRQNSQGNIYGLTYIDFRTRCVFSGSDLGKEFSAKGIMDKCYQTPQLTTNNQMQRSQSTDLIGEKELSINNSKENILEPLLAPVNQNDYLPYQLSKKKRKKKSNRLHL